ncbi:hypothetical protein, variant 1 [Exophiala sideris]|uniref:Zn(2)-C6 fungal-type domain-containing protein n=1 Tax=Exophiala sideris TaxID=1016849 RepID=A0A0D1Z0R4_9EURO|nr:hypothetical protein, variant 1 [Exophiala sideris]
MESLCMNPRHLAYLSSSSCGCFHPLRPCHDLSGIENNSTKAVQPVSIPTTKSLRTDTACQSAWACHTCRRRKVKCDKTVPSCRVCMKHGILCAYPVSQQKPGPKIGSVTCSKRREVQRQERPSFAQDRSDSNSGTFVSSTSYEVEAQELIRQCPDATVLPLHPSSIDQTTHVRSCSDYETSTYKPASSKQPTAMAQLLLETSESRSEHSGSSPVSTIAQSWILHHFHEDQDYMISPNTESLPSFSFLPPPRQFHAGSGGSSLQSICQSLSISPQNLSKLTNLYFENVTSLSLFHRPSFDSMVYKTLPPEQSVALLAAMSAISAHYAQPDKSNSQSHSQPTTNNLSPQRFYKLAWTTIQEQLENHEENKPPLYLLQALILIALYECIVSAKGRSWRTLGICVRIAHELELHLTDQYLQGQSLAQQKVSQDIWTRKEELRRAWWILWQLDIFVSTVRRQPTLIHAAEYATLLPVSDKSWYAGVTQPSCFLDLDPFLRSRNLVECGNESGLAWYIVAISLVRDAHAIANPTVHHQSANASDVPSAASDLTEHGSARRLELTVLENCLSCYQSSLPAQLAFHGEYLPFCRSGVIDAEHTIPQDYYKQVIHSMLQLARMMIYHHSCSRNIKNPAISNLSIRFEQPTDSQKLRTVLGFNNDAVSWDKYISAAGEIVRVLRHAGPDHIRYGHPLLASTFWIVAAVQLFHLVFSEDDMQKQLAASNFDLLRLTLTQHNRFWNTSDTLVKNLDTLQSRLTELRTGLIDQSRSAVLDSSRSTGESLPSEGIETHPDRCVDFPQLSAAYAADTSLSGEESDNGCLEDKVGSMGTSLQTANRSKEILPMQEDLVDPLLSAFMNDFCDDSWDALQQEWQKFSGLDTGVF